MNIRISALLKSKRFDNRGPPFSHDDNGPPTEYSLPLLLLTVLPILPYPVTLMWVCSSQFKIS